MSFKATKEVFSKKKKKPQRRQLVEIDRQTTPHETQKRRRGEALRDMMCGSGRSLRFSLNLIRGRRVRLGGDTVDVFENAGV